ncbi:uncharacterized protein [Dermacentor albipictus]|uniref:uncharacterized protein isoform X2 n=1 Tax=Dermacentor albipictus TaxID=60249 RepID=UPI0038FCAAFD
MIRTLELLALLVGAVLGADQIFWPPRNHSAASPPQGAELIFWPPRNRSTASPRQGAELIFWPPRNRSTASPRQGDDLIFWPPRNHSTASPRQGGNRIVWPTIDHSAASRTFLPPGGGRFPWPTIDHSAASRTFLPPVQWDQMFDPRESKEVTTFAWQVPTPPLCELPPVTGPCEAYMTKYYYNTTTATCESFVYGGCLGNQNKFHSAEQCEETCKSRSVVLPRA